MNLAVRKSGIHPCVLPVRRCGHSRNQHLRRQPRQARGTGTCRPGEGNQRPGGCPCPLRGRVRGACRRLHGAAGGTALSLRETDLRRSPECLSGPGGGLAEGGRISPHRDLCTNSGKRRPPAGGEDAAPGMAFVVSFTFDRLGRTVTGTPPEVSARWACLAGFGSGSHLRSGPGTYIPVVRERASHAGLPVFVYANAGLPGDGDCISPERLRRSGAETGRGRAAVVGGCCGTTPEHVAA